MDDHHQTVLRGNRRLVALSARRQRQRGRTRPGGGRSAATAMDRRSAVEPKPRVRFQPRRDGLVAGPDVCDLRRRGDRDHRSAHSRQVDAHGPRCLQRRGAVEASHCRLGLEGVQAGELGEARLAAHAEPAYTLPLSLPRRLVAAGDRLYVTLGYHAPLVALEAATGRMLMTYEGSENTDEILHHAGQLVLCLRTPANGLPAAGVKKATLRQKCPPATVAAFDAATGRRLWKTEPAAVRAASLALDGDHVFYHDQDAVVCLDAASGRHRWRTAVGSGGGSLWSSDATLVAYGEVVLWANRQQLVALSAAKGKVLWKLPCAAGFGVANPPDLFVADGLVWYSQGWSEAKSIIGYDPLSGKPVRTIDTAALATRGTMHAAMAARPPTITSCCRNAAWNWST